MPGSHCRPSALAILLGASFSVVLLVWCVAFVPPDMDEFVMYHRIACWYPNAHWQTFREGCSYYPLRIGGFEYHRSYAYIGLSSSLFYYPFWYLWNSPASNYLLATICLAAFSFGMTRALRVPAWCGLIGVCYFPITAMVIHDTGPIRLTLLSVPALVWIARRAAAAASWMERLGSAGVAAACVMVCVEDKVFYAQLAPLIAACVAACLWRSDTRWPADTIRRFALWTAVVVLLCASGSAVLLGGRIGDQTYLSSLIDMSGGIRRSIGFELSPSAFFAVLLPRFGNRMFESVRLMRLTAIFWFGAPAVFVAWAWRARAVDRRNAVLFLGAYASV